MLCFPPPKHILHMKIHIKEDFWILLRQLSAESSDITPETNTYINL